MRRRKYAFSGNKELWLFPLILMLLAVLTVLVLYLFVKTPKDKTLASITETQTESAAETQAETEIQILTEAPTVTEPPTETALRRFVKPYNATEAPVITIVPLPTEPTTPTETTLPRFVKPQNATEEQVVKIVPLPTEPTAPTEATLPRFVKPQNATEEQVVKIVPIVTEPPAVTEAPTEPEPPAEPQVEYISHKAYMNGSGAFFYPDRSLTRGEAAVLIYRLFGGVKDNSVFFYDVSEDSGIYREIACVSRYFPAVQAYYFLPDEPVLREDFFTAVCGAAGLSLPNKLLDEEMPYTAYARQSGWMNADETSEHVTRGMAAHILNLVSGRSPDRRLLMQESPVLFVDVLPSDPYYADVIEACVSHRYPLRGSIERWESVEFDVLESGLYRQNGIAYYLQEDGTLLTAPGLHKVPSGTVYVADESGLIYADGRLHLTPDGVIFCRGSGTILKNGSWNGYAFDENGYYTSGDAKLDEYVNAVYAECTTERMTQEEKLRACFDYVRAFSYLGRNKPLDTSVKTMPVELARDFALKLFDTGKGDCYNFTAAFLFLARGLGYEAEAIVGYCEYRWADSPIAHGWVMITTEDGSVRLCDPQLENFNLRAGISNEYYGAFMTTYAQSYAVYYPN